MLIIIDGYEFFKRARVHVDECIITLNKFVDALNVQTREAVGDLTIEDVPPYTYDSLIHSSYYYLFAFSNDKLIGFMEYEYQNADKIELKYIYIDERYRHLGYGEKLLTRLLDTIDSYACERIVLTTCGSFIPAMKLYTKLGFKPTSVIYKHIPTFDNVDVDPASKEIVVCDKQGNPIDCTKEYDLIWIYLKDDENLMTNLKYMNSLRFKMKYNLSCGVVFMFVITTQNVNPIKDTDYHRLNIDMKLKIEPEVFNISYD